MQELLPAMTSLTCVNVHICGVFCVCFCAGSEASQVAKVQLDADDVVVYEGFLEKYVTIQV